MRNSQRAEGIGFRSARWWRAGGCSTRLNATPLRLTRPAPTRLALIWLYAPRGAIVSVVSLMTLAGCAQYHAIPLSSVAEILSPRAGSALSADAAAIERPFLTAQPVDLAAPLTPNALAVIAVLENRDLRALRTRTGVNDAQSFAARLVPDPGVQVGYDKLISGPDVFAAFSGQLAFDLAALRRRKVVAERGRAAARQVRLDLAYAEWTTAGAARLQGVRLLGLTAQRGFAAASVAAAANAAATALRAAGRGDLAPADADIRRLAALDAADRLRLIDRDLGVARFELNRLLGLPPETVLRLAPITAPRPPPAAATLVALAADRRLDLAALHAGYAAGEADVHRAVFDQFPNLTVNLAGARDTANNYTAGPQVAVTLPLWNRNRGGIAVAVATRAQLRAEYDARLFTTRAEISAAAGALAVVAHQSAGLRAALPEAQRFADAAGRAAARGDLAQATAVTAVQSLRDRQASLAALDQAAAEAYIALELLSGAPSETWP